jgi:hypothetical protein
MLKIWQNMSFSKKNHIHLQGLLLLKTSVTMFNEFFCLFFIHWINFKLIHMFFNILKIQLYKQILQFQHQINYDFKT